MKRDDWCLLLQSSFRKSLIQVGLILNCERTPQTFTPWNKIKDFYLYEGTTSKIVINSVLDFMSASNFEHPERNPEEKQTF